MTNFAPENSEFYVVDFDRTLADSDMLLEVFIQVANEHTKIPREQIEQADRDVKLRGDSFDTAGYVRDHLANQGRSEEWEDLEKQFIHESRALNYLLPGAAELLEKLAARGKRYGILTYGNPLWQHLKLTAAGFNHVPHIVMEQKEKGRFIRHWQREDRSFRIPDALGGGSVGKVVMIDDKAVSFAEYPDAPSEGYWVLDEAKALPSQEGRVPDNISHVKTLFEVVERLDSAA